MSRYAVELTSLARRQLKKLSGFAQKQVGQLIDLLAENPRPHGYKRLHGKLQDYCRIDSGDYRVIYEIRDKELVILLIKIGDRKDIYR